MVAVGRAFLAFCSEVEPFAVPILFPSRSDSFFTAPLMVMNFCPVKK
jgi:hypothetical protein